MVGFRFPLIICICGAIWRQGLTTDQPIPGQNTSDKPLWLALSQRPELKYLFKQTDVLKFQKSQRENPSLRFIGGQIAQPHEFPHLILILTVSAEDINTCGANILTPDFVLTAAHCVANINLQDTNSSRTAVVAGEHTISETELETEQIANISAIFIHPCFAQNFLYNDIALIKLSSPLVFNEFVQPIRLDLTHPEDLLPGTNVTITGWGSPDGVDPVSDHLKKGNLVIIFSHECKEYFPFIRTDIQVCAWNNETSLCMGDSGGPLLCSGINENGTYYYLCGISSFTSKPNCVGPPSGYTRVSSYYTDWIEDVIQNGDAAAAVNCKDVVQAPSGENESIRPTESASASLCTGAKYFYNIMAFDFLVILIFPN